jgi:hypothetical protein
MHTHSVHAGAKWFRLANREIFVYPMSTLLYRQHAQHTVNIDTMHTDDLLSGNEWIRNKFNRLNV